MKQFIKIYLVMFCALAPSVTFAANYRVNNTRLTIYSQSSADSEAHAISSSVNTYTNGATHPVCGNWAYIRFEDKEMFATALSANLKGKTVSYIYSDSSAYKTIHGIGIWMPCRIISLWIAP